MVEGIGIEGKEVDAAIAKGIVAIRDPGELTGAIGEAAIARLDMNDDRHDDSSIQRARRFWIRAGWHPPSHDQQQLIEGL